MKVGKSKIKNNGNKGVSIKGVTLLEYHKLKKQEIIEKIKIKTKIRSVLFSIGGLGGL